MRAWQANVVNSKLFGRGLEVEVLGLRERWPTVRVMLLEGRAGFVLASAFMSAKQK